MTKCDIAIIGAGPYGLSIAAHLKAQNVAFRIFGSPMYAWRTQMPKGMRLKSDGFASSLYDPESAFTLQHYCAQEGIPYAGTGLPIPLDTFISYGLAFQKEFVPGLEDKAVILLNWRSTGFEITLADGETLTARRVVMAVGIGHFEHMPRILSALPEELVTHSARHNTLERFQGRQVTVVGAGASALELAALLQQAGASVQLVARKPAVRFHDAPVPGPRPLLQRLRYPGTGLGAGWKLFFYAGAPGAFRHLPESIRLAAMRHALGPAPAWFVKQQVVGKVPFNLGVNVTRASVEDGRVNLQLTAKNGARSTLMSDHVIAATGYKVDLRRLSFLDSTVLSGIRVVEQSPVLSSNFESSVPGLYFVGTAAANSFGPLLRFALGARFTAQRLSLHLKKTSAHKFFQSRVAQRVEAL
jgi:cation diffusion facilitator CzcD-associated flavoprotein CzcO